MKLSFVKYIACSIFILALTSCGNTPTSTPTSATGTVQSPQAAMMDPMAQEKNAPTVEDSLAKVGSKLKEEPAYRSCIARSTQMCGSEVISRFSQEKDSDAACSIFEDSSLKTSCINAVDTELARKKLDVSLCDKVAETNKINCVQQTTIAKAIKAKDVKLCAVLNPTKSDSTATGAIMPPSGMDGQTQCITQVIMMMEASEKTQEMCKSIEDVMSQKNCTSMVQSRIDMQKNIPTPSLPSTLVPPKPSQTGTGTIGKSGK